MRALWMSPFCKWGNRSLERSQSVMEPGRALQYAKGSTVILPLIPQHILRWKKVRWDGVRTNEQSVHNSESYEKKSGGNKRKGHNQWRFFSSPPPTRRDTSILGAPSPASLPGPLLVLPQTHSSPFSCCSSSFEHVPCASWSHPSSSNPGKIWPPPETGPAQALLALWQGPTWTIYVSSVHMPAPQRLPCH